jgi:hypothetical protein
MRKKQVGWGIIFTLLATTSLIGITFANGEKESTVAFSPEVVADYIHAVIEADRTLYTTHVVKRMQDGGVVIATEGWKKRRALPLPAQMLLMAGRKVEEGGSGLRYRLASLRPIYEENGPASVFEEAGLKVVAEDPGEVYTGIITRGDQRFFKAIYADLAVSEACVNCHNTHILSGKRDYKLGDVMGGIIISFPLPIEPED